MLIPDAMLAIEPTAVLPLELCVTEAITEAWLEVETDDIDEVEELVAEVEDVVEISPCSTLNVPDCARIPV